MDDYILTCLVDIWNACKEVELFFADKPKIFEEFKHNTMKIRAVERNVEIMGEAMGRIAQRDEKFYCQNQRLLFRQETGLFTVMTVLLLNFCGVW